MEIKTLGDFLLHEMQQRQLSARKLAELCGVDSTVINRLLDHGKKSTSDPSVSTLVKIAKATNTDIRLLIGLVVPDAVFPVEAINTQILSQRIERLPIEYREIIDGIIRQALANSGNKPINKKPQDDQSIGR